MPSSATLDAPLWHVDVSLPARRLLGRNHHRRPRAPAPSPAYTRARPRAPSRALPMLPERPQAEHPARAHRPSLTRPERAARRRRGPRNSTQGARARSSCRTPSSHPQPPSSGRFLTLTGRAWTFQRRRRRTESSGRHPPSYSRRTRSRHACTPSDSFGTRWA